ncbi:MAG TPA: hypothetical protein VFE54_07540 [Mucilaginibacter sp.]|nr:hypothetical protein [Mucilaginibacter sp.]
MIDLSLKIQIKTTFGIAEESQNITVANVRKELSIVVINDAPPNNSTIMSEIMILICKNDFLVLKSFLRINKVISHWRNENPKKAITKNG